MEQNLHKHIKKDTAKWIVVFIAILLILATSTASLVMCIGQIKPDEKGVETVESVEPVLGIESVEENGIILTMGEAIAVTAADSTNYVSQYVTAIITPESVADKYVTWSVKWADNAALKTKSVSEYIQIDESTQGALMVKINCYKSFRGSNIILECVTRQGSKKATCTITYDGKPTSMTVASPSGVTKFNLGKDSVDTLYSGQSYTCKLNLDNIFHDAGTSYNDFTASVQGVGNITTGTFSRSPRGQGWMNYDTTVALDSIKSKLISVSCSGGYLVITAKGSYMAYYESSETKIVEGNGETTTWKNKYYASQKDSNGNNPYFIITVSHRTLGFSAQYKCYIADAVESVSLSNTTIKF